MCQNDPTFYCPLLSVGTRLWSSLLHYDYHHCSAAVLLHSMMRSSVSAVKILNKDCQWKPNISYFLNPMDATNTALKVLVTDLGAGVRFSWSPTELQCIPLQAAGWCWCSLRNSFPAFLSSMSCLPGQKINWVVSKFWVGSFITLDTAHIHLWVKNFRIELLDW